MLGLDSSTLLADTSLHVLPFPTSPPATNDALRMQGSTFVKSDSAISSTDDSDWSSWARSLADGYYAGFGFGCGLDKTAPHWAECGSYRLRRRAAKGELGITVLKRRYLRNWESRSCWD